MFLYGVLFPLALNQTFIYEYSEEIEAGMRVYVNFKGKNRVGIVWERIEEKPNYEVKCIEKILDDEPIISKELKKTIEFISYYYITHKGLVLRSSLPKALFNPKTVFNTSKIENSISINRRYELNDEQKNIYESINLEHFSVNLIFGVTGSGKTEIYLRLIEDVIKSNKKAIVLVPEIALTPQYIGIFSDRFNRDAICVIHSRLTPKQKLSEWVKFRQLQSSIMIGTRSSVFVDFSDIGIVIVDEENDESYKQESEPNYNAKDIAIYRAKNVDIPVILCSATPTLESYYKAKKKKFNLYTLKKRIKEIPLPYVEIVKLEGEEMFAKKTIDTIKNTLKNGETVAIFLNRRGFSNYLLCGECGYVFQCPNCSVSLTYHKETGDLKCHWCERSYDIPQRCPKCGSVNIMERGVGTQKIVEELKGLMPDKHIERFDRDAVAKRKEFNRITDDLKNGSIDILVGTQMLSKGHDISRIGLVVVASLDSMFSAPDFRASEKAVSLIIQTAGRSGRQKLGRVIIQTISESSTIIKYIKNHDYELFLKDELQKREDLLYPPFSHLIRIVIENNKKGLAEKDAQNIHKTLYKYFTVLGPSECPIGKLRNRYRYHILVKTVQILKDLKLLREKMPEFASNVHFDVDPLNFF